MSFPPGFTATALREHVFLISPGLLMAALSKAEGAESMLVEKSTATRSRILKQSWRAWVQVCERPDDVAILDSSPELKALHSQWVSLTLHYGLLYRR